MYKIRILNLTSLIAILAIIIFQCSIVTPSFAETNENTDTGMQYHFGSEYINDVFTDSAAIITSPISWEGNDWLYAGLTIGVTVGLYALDSDIQRFARTLNSPFTRTVSSIATPFGDLWYVFPSLGGLYILGEIIPDKKLRKTALLSLESLFITGVFVQALKFTFHRHRPDQYIRYDQFDGPSFSSKNLSFPSGHAGVGFSVLTVIASEYSDEPVVPPIAYTLATLVALSRVHDFNHWSSDVFFSSSLGFFIAKSIVGYHQESGADKIAIYPVLDDEITGVLLTYKF